MIQIKSNNNSPSNKCSIILLNSAEIQNLTQLVENTLWLTPSAITQLAQDLTNSTIMVILDSLDVTPNAGDAFDIYDLTRRAMKIQRGEEWSLSRAVGYVARYFGISLSNEENFDNMQERLRDWDILKNYQENDSFSKDKKIIEFKNFNENILEHFPRPRIEPWINEGITQEVMNARGICYNPASQGIVIPHYDENGALIGIRERTLIKEEEAYGKYRPAILNGVQYNHPLGFALYNLNNSKKHIKQMGVAIVFEGKRQSRPSLLFPVVAGGLKYN